MKHRLYFLLLPSLLIVFAACRNGRNATAGSPDDLLSATEATRIEQVLSSDAMRGRKTYSPEIDRAADFIAAEFKAAGLQTFQNAGSYLQPFVLLNARQLSLDATLDGVAADPRSVLVITSQPALAIDQRSGYEIRMIGKGDDLFASTTTIMAAKKNTLILVDTSFAKTFSRLGSLKRGLVKADYSTVFVLGSVKPVNWSVNAAHEIKENKLQNVVGVLPGRSKVTEYVIFSGHYDHLGVGKAVNGDSIYNGANDDAAGTTAVIMLARYYAKLHNNERTLIFAAFTAEEIGGFGSQYFSRQFDPAGVMAMFNIEMIGTDSKWGSNSAYITGYEKTNMGEILKKNLAGTPFMFYPDPYTTQNLFYRSDNATFARLGVPAHTISTSKMDSEPDYHKVTDELKTLDMNNMAMVIRSIALSARSIVSGADTPTRVNKKDLR